MRHVKRLSDSSGSPGKSIATYGALALLLAATLYPAALVTAVADSYIQNLYAQLSGKCTITAYLRGGNIVKEEIVKRVKALPGTRTYRLLSPQDGYREFEVRLGKDAAPILAGVRPDDIPATLQLTLDRAHVSRIEPYLKQLRTAVPEVEDIRYPAREVEQSLGAIGRIIGVSDFLSYLLLTAAIVGGICACAITPSFGGRPGRDFIGIATAGLGGGALAALLLLGTDYALSDLGWQLSVATDFYALPAGAGILLGTLAGCTRLVIRRREGSMPLACVHPDAEDGMRREEPLP